MAVNERKKRTKAVIDSFPKWVVRVYVVVLTVIFPFYERNQYFPFYRTGRNFLSTVQA